MNEVIKVQMAVARHSDNIELQEGDPDYQNDTTITARRTEAERVYESLDLQKIDDAVYEGLPTKKEKDLQKLRQSGKITGYKAIHACSVSLRATLPACRPTVYSMYCTSVIYF